VFYVRHDPPLIAYHSQDSSHFLLELAMLYSATGGSRFIWESSDVKVVPLTVTLTVCYSLEGQARGEGSPFIVQESAE
jgi:hypothetical protein